MGQKSALSTGLHYRRLLGFLWWLKFFTILEKSPPQTEKFSLMLSCQASNWLAHNFFCPPWETGWVCFCHLGLCMHGQDFFLYDDMADLTTRKWVWQKRHSRLSSYEPPTINKKSSCSKGAFRINKQINTNSSREMPATSSFWIQTLLWTWQWCQANWNWYVCKYTHTNNIQKSARSHFNHHLRNYHFWKLLPKLSLHQSPKGLS